MPEQHYTATEAAALLKITRQTLYTWLSKEPELRAYLAEHHTLTRRQLDILVVKQRKKPTKPTLQEVDEALTERIEALEQRQALLEQRMDAISAPRMPSRSFTPRPDASLGADRPQNRATMSLEGKTGAISKAEAARLVSERHGVLFATVRQWPWPPEALESAEAAEQWAVDYVASVAPHRRPQGWR